MPQDKNNRTSFTLNIKTYPLEAVYGAGYTFIDRCYVFLDTHKEGEIEIALKPKPGQKIKPADLEGEFRNELLAFTLRVNLSKENKKIRQYIVEQALFAAAEDNPVNSLDDGLGYEDDPLGIAVPWEDKYGANATLLEESMEIAVAVPVASEVSDQTAESQKPAERSAKKKTGTINSKKSAQPSARKKAAPKKSAKKTSKK